MTLKPADLLAAVRQDIRQARGIIRARKADVDELVARAEEEIELARRDVAATSGPETAAAIDAWRVLAEHVAPGAAAAPWDRWDGAQWPPADARPVGASPDDPSAGDPAAGVPGSGPAGGDRPVPPFAEDAVGEDAAGEQDDRTGKRTPPLYRIGTVADGVPALVPLLDTGHLAITGARSAAADAAADAVVDSLLVRIIATTPPGDVRVSLYDPRRLGAGLGGFHALSRPGLLTVYGVEEFKDLLGSLDRDIRRIQRDVLGGGHASLGDLAKDVGRRPEPWRVVIVHSPVRGFRDDEVAHLNSVMHAGAACGIHVICRDVPVDEGPGVETTRIDADGRVLTSMTGDLEVAVEPPPAALVRRVSERVARGAGVVPDPPDFAEVVSHPAWRASSAGGVRAPVGVDVDTDERVHVLLGDDPVHALVGGPSGSGKTNFLFTMIGSLAARYSPDELEFYLLDFKEGVSFSRLAGGRSNRSWLPHARLVGVNINNDREFGLALLRFLARELERRGAAAREHEVTKLEELRAVDPDGRWPRMVAVIDEFQVLIQQQDKITDESVYLLNDLARRGRSQGIHLVLASQNVGGMQSLWGRGAILDQFTLRIALPKSRRILAEDNPAARLIPRFCAVVNAESGARQANRVARLPNASADAFDGLQRQLWKRWSDGLRNLRRAGRSGDPERPRVFDGAYVPALGTVPPLPPGEAAVGQLIDLAGSAATVRFDDAPGRNLAVVGTRGGEAYDVLASAILSLAWGHAPGSAVFRLHAMDSRMAPRVEELLRRLRDAGHEATAGGELPSPGPRPVPEYVALFAVDAATTRADAVRRAVRGLVEYGPDNGLHVLGWWRTSDRLKADVAERVGPIRNIDAWVALDVRDGELASLPGGQLLKWTPRHRRALCYDQRTGSPPQLIIPYEVGIEHDDRPRITGNGPPHPDESPRATDELARGADESAPGRAAAAYGTGDAVRRGTGEAASWTGRAPDRAGGPGERGGRAAGETGRARNGAEGR